MDSFLIHPRLLIVYFAFALCFIPFTVSNEQQPLSQSAGSPKRVAIIGAGAAGSAAAYNLRKYANSSSVPVNITVFERASYVGGRSTTVNVFDNPAYPIELGASIFVDVNYNLVNATRDLGLTVNSASHDRPRESEDTLGVWDGKGFVLLMQDTSSWWNIAKLIWRYGWSPVRAQNLMKITVSKFLRLYEEPMFPFKSLSEAVAAVGLLNSTSTPGSVFTSGNKVSPDFSRDIIQASTRVNYGQNLPLIHGLESMVCLATEGAVSIQGGNWQIFDRMLKSSNANVKVNHTVTAIERNADRTLTVTYKGSNSKQEKLIFDDVVIAGPMQYSGISITPPVEHKPDDIPYVALHVTLFSSPHRLSPKYFNLKGRDARAPETVLTTLPRGLDLGASRDGVGPAGFWSISTLRTVTTHGSHPEKHYVYKIFSPKRLTPQFLRNILDLKGVSGAAIGDLPKRDISWYHEKVWNPYPFLYPRVTFEETLLSPNIWYTGGIESFISTMETSALMGKNVAALMHRSWSSQVKEQEWDDFLSDEERSEL